MDLPIADGPVLYICFPTVQGRCKKCLHFVTTRPIEIHPTRGATWRLMRMISAWAAHALATQIAAIHEISDSTVRHYDKEVLKADLPPPDLDHLRTLLVDEKAVRRGHNYVTIVLNGDTGELLYIAEGKKREVLDRFFEPLSPEQKSSIEAVGIDRSGAYQSSIQENLPGAAIVYDRFHLMMNLNQAVDQVRRQRWREASEQDRSVIKGSRFLLLAHAENRKRHRRSKTSGTPASQRRTQHGVSTQRTVQRDLPISEAGLGAASFGSLVRHGASEQSITIPTSG